VATRARGLGPGTSPGAWCRVRAMAGERRLLMTTGPQAPDAAEVLAAHIVRWNSATAGDRDLLQARPFRPESDSTPINCFRCAKRSASSPEGTAGR